MMNKKTKNRYLETQFCCCKCERLTPIRRFIFYPNEKRFKFMKRHDGICTYCFRYTIPLRTQKQILEQLIKENTSFYKYVCKMKRNGGHMASDMFIPQWVSWSRGTGRDLFNGVMRYYRALKKELHDVMLRIQIKSWEKKGLV